MRKISHSEMSAYLDCQKKWDLLYNKGLKLDNIHLQFGSLGHKVLETRVIPDESLYPELKEYFNISSWNDYFEAIFEELDKFLKDYDIISQEMIVENDIFKGVVDIFLQHKETKRYLVMDYKFSNRNKGYEDMLLDEQMYLYATLISQQYGINITDIDIGYCNIPKKEMDKPIILKNGKLSKSKAQNTTYNCYLRTINELGLDVNEYEDILSELSGKTLINISLSNINIDMLVRICENVDNIIKDMEKGYVLEKCSYMCKDCDFLQYCKYNKNI